MIIIAQSDADILSCHSLLRQLRPTLPPKDGFLATVKKRHETEGYTLVMFKESEDATSIAAVAGVAARQNFALSKHLYILDLVTNTKDRGKGFGSQLLAWLQTYAKQQDCTMLVLDSGFARTRAHTFYERHGVPKVGYLFACSLKDCALPQVTRKAHQFDWLCCFGNLQSKQEYRIMLALSLLVFLSLMILNRPLENDTAPYGIVSLEIAGDMEKAHRILASWDTSAKICAGISLGLDYLFLILYSLIIGLACRYFAVFENDKIGFVLASAQLVSGALDAVENLALIWLLVGSEWIVWPIIAQCCAYTKFCIIACGLGYIGSQLPSHLRKYKID